MQEDPYQAGYTDFFEGNLTCKYRPRSFYAKEWLRGFNAAFNYNRQANVQRVPKERFSRVRWCSP